LLDSGFRHSAIIATLQGGAGHVVSSRSSFR
jgi:hypothetical protein